MVEIKGSSGCRRGVCISVGLRVKVRKGKREQEPALLSDTMPGISGAPGYASASALLASYAVAQL